MISLVFSIVIIRSNGSIEQTNFTVGDSYLLLSDTVGGMIECVHIGLGIDMWVNEEGKINSLPQNVLGTALWVDSWAETDFVAGDCVVTGGTDVEGYTLGLSDSKVEELLGWTHGALVSFVGGQVFFETVEV